MMKRLMLASFVSAILFAGNLNAFNPYQSIKNHVVSFGDAIEKVENVPFMGKLTNLLPVAMVAAGLKKCPGQTMVVLAGVLTYFLLQNEGVRSVLNEYNIIGCANQNSNQSSVDGDDTLFIFDGEDADDAQDQEDVENELLAAEFNDEEYYDENHTRRQSVDSPTIKFL